ncbi:MAG: DUF1080 domain-containing protein [Gemmatales bacterium]|nr:DUF1080 domain-containing protein [Gemmatales bacterium]MDW8223206.1 DUF1080 domain-containing protein [Gemmatales bacterium]
MTSRSGLLLLLVVFGMTPVLSQFADGQEVITPKEPIALFNGKDLTNFYTWLGSPGKGQPRLGKNSDPKGVFTVKDGMIRISGEVFGAITTEKEYENYHLIVEFKWGEKTFPPREKAARDSGILLHCVGEDGAAAGFWMESIECQIIEGGTGDIILVAGKNRPSVTATVRKEGNQLYYDPKGESVTVDRGRINWSHRDPTWRDVLGFRGKNDVEKPLGEWNRVECICDGDNITILVNGVVVNACTKASHRRGKIQIQSEGAELFIRRIELLPLKPRS